MGSHILESLLSRGWPVRIVIRPRSNTRFIEPLLDKVEVCKGDPADPKTLASALQGVTHIIHCAGLTRARRNAEFFAVNQGLTRALVDAVNDRPAQILRFLHVSSLAAGHPAGLACPARESDLSQPVSEYGRSKLAGEQEVTRRCSAPYTVLRPPGVYGPRDNAFLIFFQLARAGIVPRFVGGVRHLSLVYVKDLADAAVVCLDHPATAERVYYVASPEAVSPSAFGLEAARQLGKKPWFLPVPVKALWPVCFLAEMFSRLSGRAVMLSRQKYAELAAPGWVCDSGRLRQDAGFTASTQLAAGVTQTLEWYRSAGWL